MDEDEDEDENAPNASVSESSIGKTLIDNVSFPGYIVTLLVLRV
jgi:hypothetical protein